MDKIILTMPIHNKTIQENTNCEWMLILVIDNKKTELLGCFTSWEYANIAGKAYEKHFGVKTPASKK